MIDKFDGEYRWLSNFWECVPFFYENILYTSVETAYQASKSLNMLDRMAIAVMTPSNAKRAGRKLELRPDWEQVKLTVMKELLEIKFQQPDMKLCLIMTGDQELIEGNWWNDQFWGVCNGIGENNLGKILMEIRSTLKL